MVKIAFHDNCLCERGTTVSVYDYAYYNKKILNNESVIMYYGNDIRNVPEVIDKFKKEFKLYPYNNWNEVDNILEKENIDILYLQKAGEWDGKISKNKKNIVHCVFNTDYKHGDVYGKISSCFGNQNLPVVNYLVSLPDINTNMRKELNIPEDAIVFGRHGGNTQFDINYVYNVIDKITNENNKIYFLFLNTNNFLNKDKSNIIFLDKIIDLEKKTKFINTCDAMIHARLMGETFGSAVAEFSIKNKPVITTNSGDRAHLDILKDKCFIYNNEQTLYDIFNNIFNNINEIKTKDWNAYKEYSPENIMNKFNELFIKPCL
jgi:glycosyltransferase involved in cell wall biosynthesis